MVKNRLSAFLALVMLMGGTSACFAQVTQPGPAPGAQSAGPGGPGFGPPPGYPLTKLPNLPAGTFTAKTTLSRSKLRHESVDIPVGDTKLHTWIAYPAGTAKAPIVVVLEHATGVDDWQRALGDQLASEGFIAIVPDTLSGFGPKGGGAESISGTDQVMAAMLMRLKPEEALRRYKAAWKYGMSLPQANGKSAAMGFGLGGGRTWTFASEVPELNAAVVFYASGLDDKQMAMIKAPVLGLYGGDDMFTATVQATTEAMQRLGKSYEPHIFAHATHGFLEMQDLGGNPKATAEGWPLTIAFLKKHTM